jgi:hypothetical protein
MEENSINHTEEITYSYHKVRKEYKQKAIRFLPYLSAILVVVLIHFILIYPKYLIPEGGFVSTAITPYRFNWSINWAIFSIGTFTFFYLSRIAFMKLTPFIKDSIKNEIHDLGFKFQEKSKSWILFLILNSISVLLLFLIGSGMIYLNNSPSSALFYGFLIVYLVISILIPVIWRFFYDGLIIVLKDNYSVSINPRYKLRKISDKNSQLIGIYLASNRLGYKLRKNSKMLYEQIAEARWLPRKRKSIVSKYSLSPFLRFYEFSTPTNFQKQFLNIVLALQEWDAKII